MRINWSLFEDNSSTRDSIYEVADGEIKSYTAWIKACWPKDCKREIRRIKEELTFEQARKRARSYMYRHTSASNRMARLFSWYPQSRF